MRNLVIDRIIELWGMHTAAELGFSTDRLPSMSNAELLELLEDIISFSEL